MRGAGEHGADLGSDAARVFVVALEVELAGGLRHAVRDLEHGDLW